MYICIQIFEGYSIDNIMNNLCPVFSITVGIYTIICIYTLILMTAFYIVVVNILEEHGMQESMGLVQIVLAYLLSYGVLLKLAQIFQSNIYVTLILFVVSMLCWKHPCKQIENELNKAYTEFKEKFRKEKEIN